MKTYMNKRTLASVAVLAVVGAALLTQSGGAATAPPVHDYTLFDGTNPDFVDARCGSRAPYEIYGTVRAINGDATMRLATNDGDFVDYPIPDDTSFAFTHAAIGNTTDVRIILTERTQDADGDPTPGSLVGELSASRHGGDRKVSCRETLS